jgi:hypothetical protein
LPTAELVGLIVSIVSGLAVPFFNAPLLGYDISYDVTSEPANQNSLKIRIFNYALIAAENLIVSVDGSDSVTNFNFVLEPPWGDNFVQSSNDTVRNGVGYADLDYLPPMTGITLTVHANTLAGANSENYDVYVQSKQAGGLSTERINDIQISAVVLTLVGAIIFIRTRLVKRMNELRSEQDNRRRVITVDFIFMGIATVIVVATFLAVNADWYYYYLTLGLIMPIIVVIRWANYDGQRNHNALPERASAESV